tara:strand:+ start:3391 stop:4323 length:933 start_codon:yes stop_codon:yes gene_type:complete
MISTTILTIAMSVGQCEASQAMAVKAMAINSKPTIAQAASSSDQFSTLVTALKAADLVDTLNGEGNFTVFAPTNDAFAALPDGTIPSLLLEKNKGQLTEILTYHVLPTRLDAKHVVTSNGSKSINGQWIDFKSNDDGVFIDGAKVLMTDIECSNGTIHVIDAVILPTTKNIISTAKEAKAFSTLLAAAEAAGLADELGTNGPYTVFAPTDEAFAQLGSDTINELLKPENKSKLARILGHHVVSGRVYSPDALASGEAMTLVGTPLKIAVVDDKARVENANILLTDIDASNGVIHVIDSVMIPAEKQARVD